MSEIEPPGNRVGDLSRKALARVRARFTELDQPGWDPQIEANLNAGKLDLLIAASGVEFEQSKAHPL